MTRFVLLSVQTFELQLEASGNKNCNTLFTSVREKNNQENNLRADVFYNLCKDVCTQVKSSNISAANCCSCTCITTWEILVNFTAGNILPNSCNQKLGLVTRVPSCNCKGSTDLQLS